MSMGPGTSSTERYVFSPSTCASFGLIGITLYPCRRNACSARLPNLRRSDEAPMIATVLAVCAIWKDLTRIQNAVRVEGGLHALHQCDLVHRQLQAQIWRLGEADAVLAANRAFQ